MQAIKAVCLDLDDTLWPVGPAIEQAERAMLAWLAEHCPRILERHDADSLRAVRVAVARAYPQHAHDLTFLRKAAIARLAEEAGYPAEVAQPAFDAFYAVRNRVQLFDDVLPALGQLRARYRLMSLSNGNADLGAIGLGPYFELSLSAREAGAAKPDRRIFAALLERAALEPAEVIYVGDDPQADIEGARLAGLAAVWINRYGRKWPDELEPPAHRVASLAELAALLPG